MRERFLMMKMKESLRIELENVKEMKIEKSLRIELQSMKEKVPRPPRVASVL